VAKGKTVKQIHNTKDEGASLFSPGRDSSVVLVGGKRT
jgi:hypothetical protein